MLNRYEDSAEALAVLEQIQASPGVEALLGVGFLLWVAAYVVIIARGFKDHSCGMPLAALAVNLAWEVMWGFVIPDKPPMGTINKVWAVVDLVIVMQFLAYGRARAPASLPKGSFYPLTAVAFGLGLGVVVLGSFEFRDWELGGAYIAYLDNLMMSALFVGWALYREDVDGQSMWIAITKGLGTVVISIATYLIAEAVHGGSPFLTFLYVACGVLDALYCWLLWRRMKAAGIANPLRRL